MGPGFEPQRDHLVRLQKGNGEKPVPIRRSEASQYREAPEGSLDRIRLFWYITKFNLQGVKKKVSGCSVARYRASFGTRRS